MLTTNTIDINADLPTVFGLAADVAHWPHILPHYRWVTVDRDEQGRTLTEMAAWRDFIPVKWLSIQEIDPQQKVIKYKHIGGATKGMDVEWSFQFSDNQTVATILHVWDPPWPLPGFIRRPLAYLAGELFVKVIADRTLLHIKRKAELLG